MADVLFEHLAEDRFLPTPFSRGPWNPDALHGGPPAALLARAVERFEGGEAMFVSRVTVELLRPVPLAPLTLTKRWVRPGRKVQLVEATLSTETHEVARATALRIREQSLTLPSLPTEPAALVPPPGAGAPAGESRHFHDGFHNRGVEHRFVRGGFAERGPATDWIRLAVPLVEGEPTSPLCRVVAAADFGNGVSSVLAGTHTFINPDLTVYLHRYPVGEWVCLDAVSRVAPNGVGLAESQLLDERGPIGRALQSLIIEELPR